MRALVVGEELCSSHAAAPSVFYVASYGKALPTTSPHRGLQVK